MYIKIRVAASVTWCGTGGTVYVSHWNGIVGSIKDIWMFLLMSYICLYIKCVILLLYVSNEKISLVSIV